jgi:hypothetical protein
VLREESVIAMSKSIWHRRREESAMGALSIIVAFISALVLLFAILRDDSGPGNGRTASGIAVIGIAGLFVSVFVGSLSH